MLIINNRQVATFALLNALVTSAILIGYDIVMEKNKLPTVIRNSDGTCVSVTQTQNGDAYNCNDVNTVLRRYTVKVKD